MLISLFDCFVLCCGSLFICCFCELPPQLQPGQPQLRPQSGWQVQEPPGGRYIGQQPQDRVVLLFLCVSVCCLCLLCVCVYVACCCCVSSLGLKCCCRIQRKMFGLVCGECTCRGIDIWPAIHDRWPMTYDLWPVTCDTWCGLKSRQRAF